MTTEEKELLLKDLCGRLPYGVIVQGSGKYISEIDSVEKKCGIIYLINVDKSLLIDQIKPYLRPMSSMNSKEWVEYCDACVEDEKSWVWAGKEYKFTPVTHREEFLNSHHFDYRGLIPMGLALEAKEGMYKIE